MAKKRGRVPRPEDERSVVVTVRCRPEFKEWLREFAKKERATPTQLVEWGLVALAAQRGHVPPPDR
jgi:hypothetical protein